MAFHSLRARLLVIQSALVVGLTGRHACVCQRARQPRRRRAVHGRSASEPRQQSPLAVQDRYQRLDLVAQLVASFPELKNLFLTTDAVTIRDSLKRLQAAAFPAGASRSHSMGMARSWRGAIRSRRCSCPTSSARWLPAALSGRSAVGDLEIDNHVYLCALVPAEAGGTVFGFVLAGMPVDETLARALKGTSDRGDRHPVAEGHRREHAAGPASAVANVR